MTLEVKAPLPITLGNPSALENAYALDVQTLGHTQAQHIQHQLSHALETMSLRLGTVTLGDEARIALDTLVNVAIPESESSVPRCAQLKRSALRQCALDLSIDILGRENAAKHEKQQFPQIEAPVSRSEHLNQLIARVHWHKCTLDQAISCANLIMRQPYASHEHGMIVCKRLSFSVLNAGPDVEPSARQRLSQFLDFFCDSIEHPVEGFSPISALQAKEFLQRISRWPAKIIQPEHIAIIAGPIFRDPAPTVDSVRSVFLSLANTDSAAVPAELSSQAQQAAMRLQQPFKSDLLLFASVSNRWSPGALQFEFGVHLLNCLLQMDIQNFDAAVPLEVKNIAFTSKPPPGYTFSDFFECLSKIIQQTPELFFQPAATASLFSLLSHFEPIDVPTCYLAALDELVGKLAFHIPDTIFGDLAFGLRNFPLQKLPKQMWPNIFYKFGQEKECSNKNQLLKLCSGIQKLAWHQAPEKIRNYIQNSVTKIIEQGQLDELVVTAVLKSVRGSNSVDPTRPLFDLIAKELPGMYNWSPSLITNALEPLAGLTLENVGEPFIEGMILAISRTTTPFSRQEAAVILQAVRNLEGSNIDELIDLVSSRTPHFDTATPTKLDCILAVTGLIGRPDTPAIQSMRAHFMDLYSETRAKRVKPKTLLAEAHCLNLLNIPWDADLKMRYKELLTNNPTLVGAITQSPYENQLALALRQQFPNLDIRQNVLIEGIEADIYIPKLSLNIEVDGIHHMGKQRMDRIRDARLLETYKIGTFRVRSIAHEFDASIKAVIDHVNMRLASTT